MTNEAIKAHCHQDAQDRRHPKTWADDFILISHIFILHKEGVVGSSPFRYRLATRNL